jgi:Zn-dependent metalloprotease
VIEENETSETLSSAFKQLTHSQKASEFYETLSRSPFAFNWNKNSFKSFSQIQLDFSRYEVLTDGPTTIWQRKNPITGDVLEEHEELPSSADSTAEMEEKVRVSAPNSHNQTVEILSTKTDQTLEMRYFDPRLHRKGARVEVLDSNSSNKVSRNSLLKTESYNWVSAPEFKNWTAATGLMENIEITSNWFLENLNYRSWDGKGSSIIGSIRYRKNDAPSYPVAYGGNGYILIGEVWTYTGRPISEALDIVAHEFGHSVINAHTRFRYQNEGAALSEALSDVFGKSVEGFQSTFMGGNTSSTQARRNLLSPRAHGYPGSYGEYRIFPEDAPFGGAHRNSTIISHPLTLLILKDNFTLEVPYLMLHTLKASVLNPFLSLEEFAASSWRFVIFFLKAFRRISSVLSFAKT